MWILIGGTFDHITGTNSFLYADIDGSGIHCYIFNHGAGTGSARLNIISNLAGSTVLSFGLVIITPEGSLDHSGGVGSSVDAVVLEVDYLV